MSTVILDTITGKSTATTITIGSTPVVSASANSMTIRGEGSNQTSIQQGLAKSWVCLKGSDTFAVRDSFNTTSATDNGEGDYTTTRSTALANGDYATAGICSASGGGNPHYNFIVENSENSGTKIRTTTALRTYILNAISGQSTNDAPDYSMTFMGDLA